MTCHVSPSGEHAYDLEKYSRDDQGFYLDCVHCNKTAFFQCDTEDELFELFGLNDDDDGYYDDDTPTEQDVEDCDEQP
jgi:hypothetical protein